MKYNEELITQIKEGKVAFQCNNEKRQESIDLIVYCFPNDSSQPKGQSMFYKAGSRNSKNWVGVGFTSLPIITLEQLLLPVPKKVIGYNLKPGCEKYQDAINTITPRDWWNKTGRENIKNKRPYVFTNSTVTVGAMDTLMKEAGVLDLWFEPVYELAYNIGDVIIARCNDILYIGEYTGEPENRDVITNWKPLTTNSLIVGTVGHFDKIERVATPEEREEYLEIKRISSEIILPNSSYEITVNRDGFTIDGNNFSLAFLHAAVEISNNSRAGVYVGCGAQMPNSTTNKWMLDQETIGKITRRLHYLCKNS